MFVLLDTQSKLTNVDSLTTVKQRGSKMNHGLSDRIRSLAREKYVKPALREGRSSFSIRVRDLLNDLHAEGFPGGHTPQVCNALQTAKFLRENGLHIEQVEGPPSKMSPTVVVRYRTAKSDSSASHQPNVPRESVDESPETRALRLGGKLRGLLKDELKEFGGGEAFIRWVRGYDEEDAA
jgi:hypothetical protein